jgi:hypothetical protein
VREEDLLLSGGAATSDTKQIPLTATDIASIVTVNEARLSQGLPILDSPEGLLTVSEYQAKNAAVIAVAAQATSGTPVTEQPTPTTSPTGGPFLSQP